ncbi:MAG: FAD-dependent oxidoreductase, partial [Myxococcota bacterium]|nr:FAD-dependent oxidoreductase [Myxococcota bacterium]
HAAVPEEADGVRALFDRFRRLETAQEAMREGIYPPALPHDQWPAALARFVRWQLSHGRVFGRAGELRYGEVVEELIGDEGTRRILGRAGYRDQSMLMAAGLWYSWCHDYWYPRGGMQVFVEKLADVARERGADIRLRCPVTRVLAEGGRVAGVGLADGRELRAKRVVWAADAKTLYRSALPEEHRDGARARRVLAAPPSDTMVALYLGLDMPPDELRQRLGATHLFHFHDDHLARVDERLEDPDVHADVWLQWNAPILHGEEFAPAGQSAVVLQAFSDTRWMSRWGMEDGGRPRYDELKQRVSDQLLAGAERWIPDLSRRVLYRDLGSPLAVERFTGNTDGATAGWSYAPGGKPFRAPGIGPGTPLAGLWQGGQWAIWPGGVPFAAMSGRLAAELALDGWSGHLWRLLSGKVRARR